MSVISAIKKFYIDKEKRNWDKGFWAFDIHGTILKPNYQYGNTPDEFYPLAKECLQIISNLKEVTMFLYTCSHPHEVEEYQTLFKANGIVFTYINENPEVPTQTDGYGNYDKKPYMNVLFEDKAGFNPDTDWQEVYDYLMDKKVTIAKKNIVVLSGAGLDRESGILTFRDCENGLWNNYKIDEVATPEGWSRDRNKVLEFYNERRRELPNVVPNAAHEALVKLEAYHNVINVTQNVSDLLQRVGATNVFNLHGELTKARTSFGMNQRHLVESQKPIDIGYNDIKLGDEDEDGSQLRPHIVWFGEYPFMVEEVMPSFLNADIVIIVGTSFNIGYIYNFFSLVGKDTQIYYVDPEPSTSLAHEYPELNIHYIKEKASVGVSELVEQLIK